MFMTAPSILSNPVPHSTRMGWVDVVKGMSIFLVVMMHSTLGVQNITGEMSWMGQIVEFARPFRIPCFMLVSGLFLHRSINSEWRGYFDRKILTLCLFLPVMGGNSGNHQNASLDGRRSIFSRYFHALFDDFHSALWHIMVHLHASGFLSGNALAS